MNTLTVKNTVYFSIFIQIISTVITWEGLFKNLKGSDVVLKEILAIENIVQIIEFTFYLYIASYNTDVSKMGTLRYMDWYFEYADDSKSWNRGKRSMEYLQTMRSILEDIDTERATKMYNDARPKY